MNFATFERAQLAAFVYRQAAHTGSLDCMKAIAYVIRNRVAKGWGDGTWLSVMNSAADCEGNRDDQGESWLWETNPLKADDRLLQMLIRDIDDIYLGVASDITRSTVGDALYFQFINKPTTDWFRTNIVRDPQNHHFFANVGPIALFL